MDYTRHHLKPVIAKHRSAAPEVIGLHRVLPEIQALIETSRQHVVSTANLTLVWLYWNVGRVITEDIQQNQKRANYGQQLIEQLSVRLARDYGRGFSAPNLWDMKRFFEAFEILQPAAGESATARILQTVSRELARAGIPPAATVESTDSSIRQTPSGKPSAAKILQTASRQSSSRQIRQAPPPESADRLTIDFTAHHRLGWSHYRALLSVEAGLKRQFYFDQSAHQRWSVRELQQTTANWLASAEYVPTRYPEDLAAMIRLYPRRVANSYLAKTKRLLKWLQKDPRLGKS